MIDEEIITDEQQYEEEQEEMIYPKFETDEYGNPIRDARFYPFVSRVISAANKEIASKYKYNHYE